MKRKYKTSKNVIRKTMIAVLLVFLITSCTYALFNRTVIPISKASSENISWNATISITESGGAGNDIVFGEATDASDGQDDYDLPKPPFPLQLPYIIVQFNTGLGEPYNNLWHDYRQYPDDYKVWNLSILWMPEPGNESSTNVDMSWDSSKIIESGYDSVLLYENDTAVADMLTKNDYNFHSPGYVSHHFQIVCQSGTSDTNETTSFIPLTFILITIILFTLYWKKNN